MRDNTWNFFVTWISIYGICILGIVICLISILSCEKPIETKDPSLEFFERHMVKEYKSIDTMVVKSDWGKEVYIYFEYTN